MAIMILILFYEEQKSIGMQTALDLIIVDLILINIFGITYWNFMLLLGHCENNLELNLALFLTILARFYFIILVAASQSFVCVKTILIFHGQEIQDLPDEQIRIYSRKFTVVYSVIIFGIDCSMINPNNPILDLLTDTSNKP